MTPGTRRAIIVLIIIQALLNDILSFSFYFQPAFYIILIISLPKRLNPAYVLLISFFTGLIFDIISGAVWGIHSAAATAAAMFTLMIRPKMFDSNRNHHVKTEDETTYRQQIFKAKFFLQILTIVSIFFIVFILLDNFGFNHFPFDLYRFALCVSANSLVIWLMILLFNSRSKHGNTTK